MKPWMKRLEFQQETYTLTADQLSEIVGLVIDECRDASNWGESIDVGVLGLRINKLIQKTE